MYEIWANRTYRIAGLIVGEEMAVEMACSQAHIMACLEVKKDGETVYTIPHQWVRSPTIAETLDRLRAMNR